MAIVFASCAAPKEVHVVILGGQSNMQGKGVYRELDRSLKKRIDRVSKRVRVSNDGRAGQPLSFWKKDRHVRKFGPELFIGLTMAEAFPDRHFLLIKTAVGGTSLHGAWSPDWTEEKSTAFEFDEKRQGMKLYDEHIGSIRTNLKRVGGSCRFVGMAWMQGESDIYHEITVANYEANLRNLIRAYRADLGEPDLPFVFGQVNPPFRGKKGFPSGLEIVRKAMFDVARSMSHTEMIATSMDPEWPDFPKHDDDVHYDTEGQKRLGTAFANALMQFGD